MEGGLLSLKWNDHGHTFFDMLSNIRKKGSYCDVTLVSDGRFYPVHKFVLSTCSDFFDNLFSRTDCKHPIVIITNVSHKDLEALLDYMYLGEVNVLQSEIGNLMKAAEILRIKGLAEPKKSSTKESKDVSDSSVKRKRVEDNEIPSSKRSHCKDRSDPRESQSKNSGNLDILLENSGHILPSYSNSNTGVSSGPVEELKSAVYKKKSDLQDDPVEKASSPEVKVEEIIVKDEPGSWFSENNESGENMSYSETDSKVDLQSQSMDFSNTNIPWELPAATQPHPLESHLPQGMPGASGLQAPMEFTFTRRGGRKLLHNGYAYTVTSKRDDIIYWRCEERGRCGGRLKTVNDILQGGLVLHSHPPDASRAAVLKKVQEMKERATNTEELTSTIVENCTSDFPLEAIGSLPKKESLSRLIRRQRKITDGDEVTDQLRLSLRGERFVLFEEENIARNTTHK